MQYLNNIVKITGSKKKITGAPLMRPTHCHINIS